MLIPEKTTDSGYRLYSDKDLETLQQILFFKELGFPLKTIKEIVNSPTFDLQEALFLQREMLIKKRKRIDKMIVTIDKTIRYVKGEIYMSNEEKFEGFDFSKNPYEQEARERWGDEAVNRSKEKLNQMSKVEQKQMGEQMNAIFHKLAALKDISPASDEAQVGIKEWYDFLNENTGHHYTLEAFKNLGQMYINDERFMKNIDKFGNGLAKFMCNAMKIYAEKNR